MSNAILLFPRLPLLLSQCPEIAFYIHLSRANIHLKENLLIMSVRTFTMPGSLSETVAKSQPPASDAEPTPPKDSKESFSSAQKEPLAHGGTKKQPGITFAAQDNLDKLPIPDLDSTLKKYKNVLQPLQSKREQHDTSVAVQEFLRSEGPELQARLKKYATGKTSYIEQFCRFVSMESDMLITDCNRQGMTRISISTILSCLI